MSNTATQLARNFNRFDGRERDAGFASKAETRLSDGEKWDRKERRRKEAELKKQPVSEAAKPVVTNGELESILPHEFVAECIAKIEIHVARGHWDQAKEIISDSEREYNLRQCSSGATLSSNGDLGSKLALHVNRIFDVRTANLIEEVCAGTVGALLESLPDGFIGTPGCGTETVKRIIRKLMEIGVLSEVAGQKRYEQYLEASRVRTKVLNAKYKS